MQPSFRWTDGKDRDFQSFWLKTEEYYNQLVGGAGNRKAFMPYNISESVTYVLIAYCSNMARKGMNPKTLQYLMGHSDISVTMNTYTHLGLDDACEELHRMGEIERARAEQERMDGEDNGEAGMMAI